MPIDPVILALHEQVACYQRLAKLAEIQHTHVQDNRTEALIEVLSQRQQELDQVGVLEQTIAPAKRQWQSYLAGIPADCREAAESLMAETRRLLEQITTADRNDTMVLQQRKMNLGREIDRATVARQVNKKYAVSAYGRKPTALDVTN